MADDRFTLPDALPVLPLRDVVVFPDMAAPIVVGQPRSIDLVDDVLRANRLVALVTQKNADAAPAHAADLFRVGTLGVLHELGRSDSAIRLAVQGLRRIRIVDFAQSQPYLVARVEPARDADEQGIELDALVRTAKELFARYVALAPELGNEVANVAEKADPRQLGWLLGAALPLATGARQEILEHDRVSARLRQLVAALQHEIAVRQLIARITSETAEEMTRSQREAILRRHMESIQRELGEDGADDVGELRAKLEKLPVEGEVRKETEHELERLEHMSEASPEHGMIRAYVEWILKLPWGKHTGESIDVDRARRVLDEDHFDLERIKDRILDYLAVRRLRSERHQSKTRVEPILCFLGPPGVGKTSLGQSIARALGRAFVHQSLGGVHDEAEIRGHRRTYIGAMPGRILQALARAGAADPVFMLDEIDKLGAGFHGDPAAALLELLDPEQNNAFVDTYLGVPFDLSHALFICTANTADTIPPPLLDRMEVVTLAGYTELEKLQIAKRFLVPRQREANGLRDDEVEISDETLRSVIRRYTREAGVRNLEREIGTILRKVARRVTQHSETPILVRDEDLHDFLGPRRFFDELAERIDRPGVATGLAWTPAGGDVLFVEASMIPSGEERLVLTGMLGNVMRESAQAALTYLRSQAERLGIDARAMRERRTVHIHVPAGAIPKDGPSAGVTMLVALASSALSKPVRDDVAMTGEITLRGKVLPVGGIKEKVLAAHRAGIRAVILPKRNEGDLEDVPAEVRASLRFVLVESVDEVLAEAFGAQKPRADGVTTEAAPPVH